MKLKLTKDGNAVVKDGKPVYIHDDGREEAFDAPGAMKLARGQAFAGSKYITEKLNVHHELAAAFFGDSFRLENGRLTAYGAGGVPLYSHTRHGELANLDEALEQLVAQYPSKDKILLPAGASRAAPGPRQNAGTGVVISRAQFDTMPHTERMNHVRAGGKVVD
jgi:hypothetical protein